MGRSRLNRHGSGPRPPSTATTQDTGNIWAHTRGIDVDRLEPRHVLAMQRLAGNQATAAALAAGRAPVQRHPGDGHDDEQDAEQTDRQQHIRNELSVAPALVDHYRDHSAPAPPSRQVARRERFQRAFRPGAEHELPGQPLADLAGGGSHFNTALTGVNAALQFRQNVNSGQAPAEAAVNAGASTWAGNQIGAMEMGPPRAAAAPAAGSRAARRAGARAAAREAEGGAARVAVRDVEGAALRAGERRFGYAGVGGSPGVGWTDIALNAVNDGAALAGAPRQVTDITSVAASATPSSFGTSVVSQGARGAYHLATGDGPGLRRQGREIMHGEGGAYALQGYGALGVTAAAPFSRAAASERDALGSDQAESGAFGPAVRWGNEMADNIFNAHNEVPSRASTRGFHPIASDPAPGPHSPADIGPEDGPGLVPADAHPAENSSADANYSTTSGVEAEVLPTGLDEEQHH